MPEAEADALGRPPRDRIQRAVAKGLGRWRGLRRGSVTANAWPAMPRSDADGGSNGPVGTIGARAGEPGPLMARRHLAELRAGALAPAGSNGNRHPPGVVAALPRRAMFQVRADAEFAPPPMRQPEVFETSVIAALGRLVAWLAALCRFVTATLRDRVQGRDTVERRAVRLREALERTGGTFIKFGQQLSVRADVLPYAYCRELIKMLDRVPPFPTEQAIATIERATGKRLTELFAVFDPEPIGSASLACVYQAQLFSGERVAVKVRRPQIGERFAADLRALDWLLILAEKLTIVRPGFTANLRHDLRQTLFEELDFRKEARYQDLFRRRARKKASRHFFSAPRVYFDLSSEEVIVQEFASGLWLWELIEIIDRQDEAGLAYLRRMDIDPKAVATRLHWVAQWGMISDLFFHADPHPANVIVRPHNRLVFIDFGSCGTYDHSRRAAMQQLFYHQQRDDIAGMVQASLHLLEPLPPIDVGEFARELQAVYRQQQYGMRSKQAFWFEHCSSGIFIDMIGLSRKYNIPMNGDVLRIARANLLYDTLAARLHSGVTSEKVYRRFAVDMGKQSRKRVLRALRRRLAGGLAPADYIAVERTVDTGVRLMYRLQRFLETPGLKLPYLVEKWVYAASSAIRLALLVAVLAGSISAAVCAADFLAGREVQIAETLRQIAANRWFQVLAGILLLLTVRKVLFRLSDKGAAES